MSRPMRTPARRIGAPMSKAVSMACWVSVMASWGSMSGTGILACRCEIGCLWQTGMSAPRLGAAEAFEKHADDERPAIDQNEQKQLQRQRDHHGRKHHHAHRDRDA